MFPVSLQIDNFSVEHNCMSRTEWIYNIRFSDEFAPAASRSNDISGMLCCSNSFPISFPSPSLWNADFPNSTLTLQKKIGRERIIGGKCWVAGHEERSSESVYIWRSKQRALSYLYCEVGSCSRPGQRHECRTEEEVQNVTWKPNIYRALITVLLVFVYLLLNSAIQ